MNPEQIKIIAVVVGTLIFAFLIEPSRSNISDLSKRVASLERPSQSVKSKSTSSKPSCTKKGIKLYGDVQFVDSFPDLTIKYVSSFPDINVEFVSSFPSNCGQWKVVESFPDFTVQVVSSFPDLEVKKVSSFPGME